MAGNNGRENTISVNGIDIAIHGGGTGERLLVLHGAKDFHPWHPYHDMLAKRFDVAAPVHPGFGDLPRPPAMETIDDLAYFYLDLVEDAGWTGVHLMGIGMGGWIAAEMAVKSCAALASLILVDAVGIKVSDPATPDIVDTYPKPMDQRFRMMWRDPDKGRACVGDPIDMSEEDIEKFIRHEESETLYGWKPFMHDPALPRRLHRVRVPALVLWGADDRVVAPSYGAAYAAAIPGAAFETVADAGHLPHLERPEAVARAVMRFIDGTGH